MGGGGAIKNWLASFAISNLTKNGLEPGDFRIMRAGDEFEKLEKCRRKMDLYKIGEEAKLVY